MRFLRKHGIWVIPTMIAIILFCLHYIFLLHSERQLPSSGWSRTIELPVSSEEGKQYAYTDKSGYHLYTYTGKTITYTKLNKNLQLISRIKNNFPHDIVHIYWGNGNRYVFKQDLDVYYFDGHQSVMLAKEAGPTVCDGTNVFFGKNRSLFKVDIASGMTSKIEDFPENIQTLFIGSDHGILVTTENEGVKVADFYYIHADSKNVKASHFGKFPLGGNAHVSQSTSYVLHDGNLGLYFPVADSKGGMHYLLYYTDLPINKIETNAPMDLSQRPITIYSGENGVIIEDPLDVHFSFRDGKPTLLFGATGLRTKREEALNIYEAYPHSNGKWMAERRSTTKDAAISPFWLGKDNIAWYAFTNKGTYTLEATSQNAKIIKESLKLKKVDYTNAFSESLLSLSRVLILILLSFVFGLGALFIYGIISFTKVEWVDNDLPAVKWLMIAAFLIGEIWLANIVISSSFVYYAPGYLTFSGAGFIIPLIIAVFALFLVRYLRAKDAGILNTVSAFGIIYIVTMSFLIGPYYF
ncbi:MAG: hypothetical protein ACO1OC_06310 [Tuberibacillus sp.]